MRMRALFDIAALEAHQARRAGEEPRRRRGRCPPGSDTLRREIKLKQALDSETAKKVSAAIKDAKLKKVQASIQGDQVRVSGPDKDALQEAMALLRRAGLRGGAEVRELPVGWRGTENDEGPRRVFAECGRGFYVGHVSFARAPPSLQESSALVSREDPRPSLTSPQSGYFSGTRAAVPSQTLAG